MENLTLMSWMNLSSNISKIKIKILTHSALSKMKNEDNSSIPIPNKKDKNIMTEEVRDSTEKLKRNF